LSSAAPAFDGNDVFPLPNLSRFLFTPGPLIGRGAFGLVNLAIVITAETTTTSPLPPTILSPTPCVSLHVGALVAMKSIPCPDDVSWLSARREAAALRAAASPYVVRLHGIQRLEPAPERPNPVALLIMEYLSSGTLSQIALEWSRAGGQLAGPYDAAAGATRLGGGGGTRQRGLPEGLVRRYTSDVVGALEVLHRRGLAHRDIKGANLLLASDGTTRLADFGSCKLSPELEAALAISQTNGTSGGGFSPNTIRPHTAISAQGVHRTSVMVNEQQSDGKEKGTIAWMAREVVVKRGSVAESEGTLQFWQRADMWSLGCTVLELLTGQPPWHGEAADSNAVMLLIASDDIRARIPNWVTPAARAFLRACFEPEPSNRATAAELRNHAFVNELSDRALFSNPSTRGIDSSRVDNFAPLNERFVKFTQYRPPPTILMNDGIKEASVIKSLRACDQMKSEVRLGCRFAQHWFLGKRIAESGWVDQCLCSEERLTADQMSNDEAASILSTAAEFGNDCETIVRTACDTPALCLHRACAMSVLFGELTEEQWSVRSEGAAVLLSLSSAGLKGSANIVAFTMQLLTARVRSWVDSSVLRQETSYFTEKAPPPSLLGIASSLQWLASAREAIANRSDEENYEFGITPVSIVVPATYPDFAVLFCTRLHVWVAEVEMCLRVLVAVKEWWSDALQSSNNDVNLTECADSHRSILRTVYARSLAIRRTWTYGRTAIGFGGERHDDDENR
jgi:serine/threonine protein kinase